MKYLPPEQLRKMSRGKLAKHFGWSEQAVCCLVTALKPERFPVLTNNKFTAAERAKILEITERTAEIYRGYLLKAHVAEPKRGFAHNKNYELIMNAAVKPVSRDELCAITKLKYGNLMGYVNRLKEQGELLEFRLCSRTPKNSKYGWFDLFGELTKNRYLYRPAYKIAVVEFIAAHLPLEKLLEDRLMRASLTHHLKECLPDEICRQMRPYHRLRRYSQG
ncbi:MAG: hypothetical protein V1839_00905 [archaeon]